MSIITENMDYILFGIVGFVVIAYIFGWINDKKDEKSINKELRKIDTMKGTDFEKYIEQLFRKLGYKVERTQDSRDYGADLIVSKRGKRIAIQTKRYKANVGLKAVQEVYASMAMYKCNSSMVITNSFYTESAIELAKRNKVTLWDRDDLIEQILHTKNKSIMKKRLTTV